MSRMIESRVVRDEDGKEWKEYKYAYQEEECWRRPSEPIPVIPNIDVKILEKIEQNPKLFDMSWWARNTECGTAYCRAGWACQLAREQAEEPIGIAKLLQDFGWGFLAAMLYHESTPGVETPDWSDSRADALFDIKKRAALQKEQMIQEETEEITEGGERKIKFREFL